MKIMKKVEDIKEKESEMWENVNGTAGKIMMKQVLIRETGKGKIMKQVK